MASANDQLRQARERTESPTHPGECLSRHELAELVNAYYWDQYSELSEIDANYLGKLERGVIRWPNARYRAALRSILGASTDGALGFTNRRRSVVRLVDVDRKQFLRVTALGAGAAALTPVAALLEGCGPTPAPNHVGRSEIEQIRTAASAFQGWFYTYGSGVAREAVLAQLRWSAGLLGASYPTKLRSELHSAVGYLAWVCGFMAFDSCAHDDARRIYRFALACAEESGDWQLRARVLYGMADQAVWIGHPDEGRIFTEQALMRVDRLTASVRAQAHAVRAKALGKMNRIQDTLIAIGTADDEFAHRDPTNDPTWMAFYGHAQHVNGTGEALANLALHGRPATEATTRLTTAAAERPVSERRQRAIDQTKLARLTMATGDPREAAAVGMAALDTAGTVRSGKIFADLRELGGYAARHSKITEVAALQHRISHLVLPR